MSQSFQVNWHKTRYFELGLFLFALTFRLFILVYSGTENYYYDALWDARIYWDIGRNLANGNGYSVSPELFEVSSAVFNANPGPTSIEPPLYPVIIATSITLFGDTYFPLRVIQAVAGALTTIIIFRLGKRSVSPEVGIVAAALFSLHPPLIVYSRALSSEVFVILFVSLAVLNTLRFIDHLTVKNAILAALPWTLAFLTRPENALYAVVIAVYALIVLWRDDPKKILQSIAYAIPGVITFVLLWGVWVVHNWTLHEAFIPATTLSGANMWEYNYFRYNRANNPDRYPEDTLPEFIDVPNWDNLSEIERDEALGALGMNFIREYPDEFVKFGFSRILMSYPLIPRASEWETSDEEFVGLDEVPIGEVIVSDSPAYSTTFGRVSLWGFRIVFVSAILGTVVALRKRHSEAFLFVAIVGMNIASAFLIRGQERARLQIEPFILLLAAIFIVVAINWILSRYGQSRSQTQ